MIYVGTSGFSYPEWKGVFYPDDLSSKDYLSFYARHFRTTEVNNTFYRSPSEKTARNWAEQVPEDFRFTLKLNRKITHQKKLENTGEEMQWFLKGTSALGLRLGSILVQLPPYLRKKAGLLEEFLEEFSSRAPLALEFRHPSWMADDIFEILEKYAAALVLADWDDQPALRICTGGFVYLRLRKTSYPGQEVEEWAQWLLSLEGNAFVYFKHDTQAPALARQLVEVLQRS